MTITFKMIADDFQTFDIESLQKMVGKFVMFSLDGLSGKQALLKSVEVSPDGRVLTATVSLDRDAYPHCQIMHRR